MEIETMTDLQSEFRAKEYERRRQKKNNSERGDCTRSITKSHSFGDSFLRIQVANTKGNRKGRPRTSKRILHALLHPSINCRRAWLSDAGTARGYNTFCVGLDTQPVKVLILFWRILRVPSCMECCTYSVFSNELEWVHTRPCNLSGFCFFPWFG